MISASITQINAEVFLQEGYELSLDAIVPSLELTGSFTPFQSHTQLFIYDFSHTLLYQNTNYEANGSFLPSNPGSSTTSTTSSYNQFVLNPQEDVYNQGYSSGMYYALYNFVDYELGSETQVQSITPADDKNPTDVTNYSGHPYFISEISGDRTELRIQNNFLSQTQIENYYNNFSTKINARENADEFYISFDNNRNFIAVNSQLKSTPPDSTDPTSILIKLYKPLPPEFVVEQQLQIISKAGETQVFAVDFKPNLQFVDNLLSLKGPNYNIDLKDRINNSTNKKTLSDLVNTASSQSYYQFNNLNNQKGVVLRKNWDDWSQFVKYSSAEQRLNNFKAKMTSIESYENELSILETVSSATSATPDYSSSYNNISNNINKIISKFDSYEYFLYYITGSESWPKYTSTYPYTNYSVTSSAISNWFGSTDETSPFYNSGKNQIFSASIYDENNQDYLYYLIPSFITDNNSNDKYTQFVNMTGQAFDEMYLYTEAVEQVRNTNSGLTGDVLPLGLADEVIESLGFETYGNSFNSIGFNPNQIGVEPPAGSGLEYITRYIDIASGSVVNYYDKQESTLGYVIALADPSFPYPVDNAAQEIYKRIFHNMISLVKRKGTVTGLRQLINIWGVPSTMLRISEFGGKNKDDENDYDLWMNRYSTAFTTYNYQSGNPDGIPSASVRIPWQPLASNYIKAPVKNNISEYIVPDCIQFRFKCDEIVTPTSNFSQSLLVKGNLENGFADFALTLAYSGSQSGSYSGSVLPNNHQYGDLTFAISGSSGDLTEVTTPISLPFFNNGWWSVQLQRLNHIPMTFANSNDQTFELKVANNIYDGYDGNKIGFTGSATLSYNFLNPSYNLAWNTNHGVTSFSPSNSTSYARGNSAIVLGGMMEKLGENNQFAGATAADPTNRLNIGKGFSGSFQEFKLYSRALSSSQFNDYVMNPESIQGHSDSNTGEGSSYDLLSFRLPLGNELEYTEVSGSANSANIPNSYGGKVKQLVFGGNSTFAGKSAFGSLHPSLVNKEGSLFTGSFILTNNQTTSSQYSICWQGRLDPPNDQQWPDSITSSYLAPNTEINYMDQPAAGIRNRIKNKIQVIDGNEYGKVLSPFRSIQQEFEQSSSYTEDLNSLEVGFSFENEINDDIIATFGHGVVSDAIADPRFLSESSDRYPELTRIAEDYFKKYQGVTIFDPTYNGGRPTTIEKKYDYNRLIQFYETSLFKAIKNYIPARTSLSTGIIVKQHLLERNKATTVIGVNPNTPMAKTPETGSDSWGYTTQTGFNSVISNKNLLITSSIPVGSLTGSAGGSVNKYNIITNEGFRSQFENDNLTTPPNVLVNLFQDAPPDTVTEDGIFLATDSNGDAYIESEFAFRSQIKFFASLVVAPAAPGVEFTMQITSSMRGGIFTNTFPLQQQFTPSAAHSLSENYVDVYPDERLYIYVISNILDSVGNNIVLTQYVFEIDLNYRNQKYQPKASQQVNWYIDNFTGENKVKDTQEEFYDGEFSGSNFEVIPAQYNPYRIFADGSNLNPDQSLIPGFSAAILNLAATPYNVTRFPTVTTAAATAVPIRATGSLLQYSGSYNGVTSGDALLIQDVAPNLNNAYQWVKITSEDGVTRTYNAIGSSNTRFDLTTYPAQETQFILSEEPDIFRTQTDGGIFSGTVTSGGGKTENFTDQYGKKIVVDLVWTANTVQTATITNNNPVNQNGSLWPKVDSVFTSDTTFSFNGNTLSFTLSSAASLNNLPAFGVPNLLMVQFVYSGASILIAGNLENAIESANGHNGSLLVTRHINQGASNRNSLQLFNTVVGNTYANAIQGSTLGANDFADNSGGICVLDEGGVVGDYYFPNTIQRGVDQPTATTKYLQNSITNLFPGVTYDVSFDITNYATDGLGNSNFDVGLSTLDSPGGTANGISSTARATSNTAISHSWTQAAGTSVAQFFSATGTYANISNVNVSTLDSVLAPKHLYPLDAFTIVPTASQLFQNSSYNPIINNVSGSRLNSYLFDQDFDPPTPSFIEGALARNEGIPADYTLLLSSSQLGFEGANPTNDNLLEYSEVPDSNYTIKSSINPRYDGSKITSADYNFGITEISLSESAAPNVIVSPLKTPSLRKQSKITFLNGETGSWKGDSTNEYQSAIDNRPIYFAHFKSSYENLELFDTSTFNIDQLIQIPFSSIQNEQAPIVTSSQLTGNNENLTAVGSTFSPNRKAKAIYNQATKQFRNLSFVESPLVTSIISPTLDYSNITDISSYITFPAQEITSYFSNQKEENSLITTQSFFAPQWISTAVGYDVVSSETPNNVQWVFSSSFTTGSYDNSPLTTNLTSSVIPSPNNQNLTSVTLFETGSSPSGDKEGYGLLYIQGYSMEADELYDYLFSATQTYNLDIFGPHLQIMNNINKNIDNGDQAQPTASFQNNINQKYNTQPMFDQDDGIGLSFTATTRMQKSTTSGTIPGPLPVLPDYADGSKGPANYFRFNYSQSALTEYNNTITDNITIERGDIIRVTYSRPVVYSDQVNTNLTTQQKIITKNFQVLGYELAAPEVVCNEGFGSSGAGAGFGTTNQDDTFFTTVDNLPAEGIFSSGVLNERYNMMAANTQSLFAYFTLTQGEQLSMWTGSVVSSKVLYKAGEPDPTIPNLICITGSIELKLKTGQNGSAGSDPLNNPSRIALGTTQTAQRGTLNGKNVASYINSDENQRYQTTFQQFPSSVARHNFDAGFMYDTLKVTPDPSKFEASEQILSGSIMAATLIKRKDDDTKVVLDLNQPNNQIGSLTPSGDGYLIPDDLTSIQMDNVQKLINVLKSQNAFTNPPDANETNDVS